VSARFGVFYGTVPCSFALYTCLCGAAVVEGDLDRDAPAGWRAAGNDVHLCPGCARARSEDASQRVRSELEVGDERGGS
jgi:hypothetical protein